MDQKNIANANGEGAERVITALNQPITTLNNALGQILGSNSNSSDALASVEITVKEQGEELSKYRTFGIIGVVVCLVLAGILILK